MASLTPVFVDYETFWSQDHSISRMSPIKYVMHPQTEVISLAIKVGKTPTCVVFGEDAIAGVLRHVDWSDKLLVAHNNEGFDSLISAWRFGVRPAMWGCTLAMARPHHAKTAGGSLKALAEHYQLGVKDSTALLNTKGRHLKDFTGDEITAMREYNAEDTNLCAKLFFKLLPMTSKQEMKLIDMTIRMLVEPQFEIDRRLLETTLKDERARKSKVLLDLATMIGAYEPGMEDEGAVEAVCKTLGSAAKFGKLLTDLGVAVPTKISPTTGKEAPALAKTDEGFIALTESDDPVVAAAAQARLGVKSTLLESRVEAFLEASEAAGGRLPIPTKYYGADTTGRRSGFLYNPLNLPRVSGKPSDCLRNSMKAPAGHKIVVADLAGIELRVNLMLWQVPYAMALYAENAEADLYKPLASEVLGVPIEGMPKMVRQAGKAMHLGCGFGLGSKVKYIAVAKQMAQIVVTEDEAEAHIKGYRRKHPEVVQGWKTCHKALQAIYSGADMQIDPWGLCRATEGGIKTPKGMIRYPHLRQETDDHGKLEWVYGEGRHKARIYAGKVTENIVQHLSRFVICDHALEIHRRTGRRPAMEVYDELIYIVPEDEAGAHLGTLLEVMSSSPDWWPELVLFAEGDIADTYGAAK